MYPFSAARAAAALLAARSSAESFTLARGVTTGRSTSASATVAVVASGTTMLALSEAPRRQRCDAGGFLCTPMVFYQISISISRRPFQNAMVEAWMLATHWSSVSDLDKGRGSLVLLEPFVQPGVRGLF